mmetsp:Transcript_11301/g.42336  ORF Transcript_11301/g.42336 Transcript_11301/m.42336 type:complete len:131 (-) Transcript_11301:246-638(-)
MLVFSIGEEAKRILCCGKHRQLDRELKTVSFGVEMIPHHPTEVVILVVVIASVNQKPKDAPILHFETAAFHPQSDFPMLPASMPSVNTFCGDVSKCHCQEWNPFDWRLFACEECVSLSCQIPAKQNSMNQ